MKKYRNPIWFIMTKGGGSLDQWEPINSFSDKALAIEFADRIRVESSDDVREILHVNVVSRTLMIRMYKYSEAQAFANIIAYQEFNQHDT